MYNYKKEVNIQCTHARMQVGVQHKLIQYNNYKKESKHTMYVTKGTLVYTDGIHKHSLHKLSLTGLRDRAAATVPTLHDILECFLVTHIQQSLNIAQR